MRRLTRSVLPALAGACALSLVSVGAPAQAAPLGTAAPVVPAALGDNGPFSARGEASLLTLDIPSLAPSVLPQTNVDLARSVAGADSDGDLDTTQAGDQRTAALAGTTGTTSLLGADLDLQTTVASAPESEAFEDVLLPLPVNPLLDLEVIRTSGAANWISGTECVAGDVPLSQADQALADLLLLEIGEGQSVVELDTDDGDGAVDTQASTFLAPIDGPGDARAVQARATTTVSSANVLNGLAGEGSAIEVDVVQAPDYTASASGLPGGASVTGDRPVVNVTIGDTLIVLDDDNPTEDAVLTDLVLGDLLDLDSPEFLLADLLDDLGLGGLLDDVVEPVEDALTTALGELQPIVRLSIPYEEAIAADGTSASVTGAILRVELLPPAALGAAEPLADLVNQILAAIGADIAGPLLSLDLGPVSAEAVAPAGGIDCDPGGGDDPLRELNKHASAQEVAPGGTFDYSISVPNRGPCTVTDVVVTDTISGPARFEVIGTEPPATVAGNVVTFDVGTLEPNEVAELTITVRVPADAPDGATFDDVVAVSGLCDGEPVDEEDTLDDVPTVRDDFEGPCSVEFSNKDASHVQVTPGQTFAYYVHAFNSGAEDCTGVEVIDTLDDRLTFVSCNKGCENAGQTVTWELATLPGGSSASFTVVVQVDDDATGVLGNTAVIDPDNGDSTTVTSTGPTIGEESVPKDPISPIRGGRGPGTPPGELPRTGRSLPTAAAVALGGAALALFALRRRTEA
jgi:uncharacterized repeat protein (TIGR01451 family)